MPFPITLGPNTYVRSDFTDSKKYPYKIPEFMSDLSYETGMSPVVGVTSSVNFSNTSHTLTYSGTDWAVPGEGLFLYHLDGAYQYVTVSASSPNQLVVERQLNTPYAGVGTFISDVRISKALPESSTPFGGLDLVDLEVLARSYGEDFLGSFPIYSPGTYQGGTTAPFTGTLSNVEGEHLASVPNVNLFIPQGYGNSIYTDTHPTLKGRGSVRVISRLDEKYAGVYLGGIPKAARMETAFFPHDSIPYQRATVVVGMQSMPASGSPSTDLCGYPYEFIHGQTEIGPRLVFEFNKNLRHPIEIWAGNTPAQLTQIPILDSEISDWAVSPEPITVTMEENGGTASWHAYCSTFSFSGSIDTSANHADRRKPYVGVYGMMLLDFIWGRTEF